MSIENYHANTKELDKKAGVSPEAIFDYELSPIAELFDYFFEFCRENLLIHEEKFNISPARFFYENERHQVNACAMTMNGVSLIMMTAAMQVQLYDHFYRNNDCFEADAELVERYDPISKGNDPPGYVMYQTAIQFSYYHELAHLIQRSELLPTKLHEKYEAIAGDYDEYKHILEFDADCHAANFMVFHILAYIEKNPAMSGNAEVVRHIISLYTATIFIYFTFLDGGGTIYFKAGDHPHPINRIIYITSTIVETVRLNLKELELDLMAIVREGFDLSQRFHAVNGMPDAIEPFDKTFEENEEKISEYLLFLTNEAEKYPELTRNRLDEYGNPI